MIIAGRHRAALRTDSFLYQYTPAGVVSDTMMNRLSHFVLRSFSFPVAASSFPSGLL